MDKPCKEEAKPAILSPEPIRPSRFLKKCSPNPFEETSTVGSATDQCDRESVCSELSFILSSPINFPTSKSLPSPLFGRQSERLPARHKVNPIIHDENFIKFDRHD